MPARSKEQRTAANIAMAIKKGKVKAQPGTPSAQMAKMPAKSLEKFTTGKIEKKKSKKEGYGEVCDPMYLVRKPMRGMPQDQLVMPLDPMQGISPLNVNQTDVLKIVNNEKEAQRIAAEAYNAHVNEVKALQEKKLKVIEKTKKTMDLLEKKRKSCMEMMKENPGNVSEYRHKVAELATKIEELMNTLERVEKSRKLYEAEEETKKKFTYKDVATKQDAEIEAKDEKEAKALVLKKGGDVTTVKEKPEPEPAPAPEPAEKPAEEEKSEEETKEEK